MFYTNLQSSVWKRHVGAHAVGLFGLFQCKGLEEPARHEVHVNIPSALDHFAPTIRQYIFVLLSSDHSWTQNFGFNFLLCFGAIVFLFYIVLRIFVLHDW